MGFGKEMVVIRAFQQYMFSVRLVAKVRCGKFKSSGGVMAILPRTGILERGVTR